MPAQNNNMPGGTESRPLIFTLPREIQDLITNAVPISALLPIQLILMNNSSFFSSFLAKKLAPDQYQRVVNRFNPSLSGVAICSSPWIGLSLPSIEKASDEFLAFHRGRWNKKFPAIKSLECKKPVKTGTIQLRGKWVTGLLIPEITSRNTIQGFSILNLIALHHQSPHRELDRLYQLLSLFSEQHPDRFTYGRLERQSPHQWMLLVAVQCFQSVSVIRDWVQKIDAESDNSESSLQAKVHDAWKMAVTLNHKAALGYFDEADLFPVLNHDAISLMARHLDVAQFKKYLTASTIAFDANYQAFLLGCLTAAVSFNNRPVVKWLMAQFQQFNLGGINLNRLLTWLTTALKNRFSELAYWLAEKIVNRHGVSAAVGFNYGWEVFSKDHFDLVCDAADLRTLEIMIQQQPFPRSNKTIQKAIKSGCWPLLKTALKVDEIDREAAAPLKKLAATQSLCALMEALESFENLQPSWLIVELVGYAVRVLTEKGANLSVKTTDGQRSLLEVLTLFLPRPEQKGLCSMTSFLLTQGFKSETKDAVSGELIFHQLIRNGAAAAVRVMVARYPGLVDLEDERGRTAVYIAVESHQTDCLRSLMVSQYKEDAPDSKEQVADYLNQTNNAGESPVHFVFGEACPEQFLKTFLKWGGSPPLMYDQDQRLLEHFIETQPTGFTPAFAQIIFESQVSQLPSEAEKQIRIQLIDFCLKDYPRLIFLPAFLDEKNNINELTLNDRPLFWEAVKRRDFSLFQLFVEQGAWIHLVDSSGNGLLHYFVISIFESLKFGEQASVKKDQKTLCDFLEFFKENNLEVTLHFNNENHIAFSLLIELFIQKVNPLGVNGLNWEIIEFFNSMIPPFLDLWADLKLSADGLSNIFYQLETPTVQNYFISQFEQMLHQRKLLEQSPASPLVSPTPMLQAMPVAQMPLSPVMRVAQGGVVSAERPGWTPGFYAPAAGGGLASAQPDFRGAMIALAVQML